MGKSHARAALLAGASLVTLGEPGAALAATIVDPGISHIVGPGAVVSDTLTICDLGDSCTFGVAITDPSNATAIVDSAAYGGITQLASGGDINLLMTNGGSADVHALASVTDVNGGPPAFAEILHAVRQRAVGSGDVAVDIENSGSFDVAAIANATGEKAAGTITFVSGATTSIFPIPGAVAAVTGIFQRAESEGGDAVANIENSGIIEITASANASATETALAQASGRAWSSNSQLELAKAGRRSTIAEQLKSLSRQGRREALGRDW